MDTQNHKTLIKAAVESFCETKKKQLAVSGDSSNRGAVVGGKQLDAFAELLKTIAIENGIPEDCIYTSQAYLPGFFRSSKNWDFLIIAPNKKLIAAVELKSQIGSYGNISTIGQKRPLATRLIYGQHSARINSLAKVLLGSVI